MQNSMSCFNTAIVFVLEMGAPLYLRGVDFPFQSITTCGSTSYLYFADQLLNACLESCVRVLASRWTQLFRRCLDLILHRASWWL
jgi:hypothetical protein